MFKKTNQYRIFGIGVTALVAAALACSLPIQQTGPAQTQSETVELGAAESANVEITMGAGELAVSSGAADLLEAEFTFNIDDWEPEVDYSVNGDRGRLTIRQKSLSCCLTTFCLAPVGLDTGPPASP